MPSLLNKILVICCLAIAVVSCSAKKYTAVDPFEPVNRVTFKVNKFIDRLFIRPAASFYEGLVPNVLQYSVKSFVDNIGEVSNVANDILQGEVRQTANDLGRLIVNSTVGVLGLFDVASRLGMTKHKQDFGLTLAKWGYRNSSYFVIPILGPSTFRDTLGIAVDYTAFYPPFYMNDTEKYWLTGIVAFQKRVELLPADKILDAAAVDEYVFTRNAYLQRRNYLIGEASDLPHVTREDQSNGHDLLGEPPA